MFSPGQVKKLAQGDEGTKQLKTGGAGIKTEISHISIAQLSLHRTLSSIMGKQLHLFSREPELLGGPTSTIAELSPQAWVPACPLWESSHPHYNCGG